MRRQVPSRTFELVLGILYFANLLIGGAVVAIHRFSPKVMRGNERGSTFVPWYVVTVNGDQNDYCYCFAPGAGG